MRDQLRAYVEAVIVFFSATFRLGSNCAKSSCHLQVCHRQDPRTSTAWAGALIRMVRSWCLLVREEARNLVRMEQLAVSPRRSLMATVVSIPGRSALHFNDLATDDML